MCEEGRRDGWETFGKEREGEVREGEEEEEGHAIGFSTLTSPPYFPFFKENRKEGSKDGKKNGRMDGRKEGRNALPPSSLKSTE
jgi:hypothetical protein